MNQYLLQYKSNTHRLFDVVTIDRLFEFIRDVYANPAEKPESVEIFRLNSGYNPQRMWWSFDGKSIWIEDRYGGYDEHYYPKSNEE